MTKKRNDDHSTEFGLWLRNVAQDKITILRVPDLLDSKLGFVSTNVDYMWLNRNTGEWMLVEEKRHNNQIEFPQSRSFAILDKSISTKPIFYKEKFYQYKGFHRIVFQNTNPKDGLIWLDDCNVTENQLISFLRFLPLDKY